MKACGKAILFGEHAVVRGKPGVAVPLQDVATTITLEHGELSGDSSVRRVFDLFTKKLDVPQDFSTTIDSTIPFCAGLGSSASLCVAAARSLNERFSLGLTTEAVNELAFAGEKLFHGTPSGIDNSTIAFEQPVFFNGTATTMSLGADLHLVLASSGTESSTKKAVEHLRDADPTHFSSIEQCTLTGYAALKEGDLSAVGECMNRNHRALQQLGVSSRKLDQLVETSLLNGALGAKLTGAGLGGFMVALVDRDSARVVDALERISPRVFEMVIR